jgi:hypothetical protein
MVTIDTHFPSWVMLPLPLHSIDQGCLTQGLPFEEVRVLQEDLQAKEDGRKSSQLSSLILFSPGISRDFPL